jgi:hypothetical protein
MRNLSPGAATLPSQALSTIRRQAPSFLSRRNPESFSSASCVSIFAISGFAYPCFLFPLHLLHPVNKKGPYPHYSAAMYEPDVVHTPSNLKNLIGRQSIDENLQMSNTCEMIRYLLLMRLSRRRPINKPALDGLSG